MALERLYLAQIWGYCGVVLSKLISRARAPRRPTGLWCKKSTQTKKSNFVKESHLICRSIWANNYLFHLYLWAIKLISFYSFLKTSEKSESDGKEACEQVESAVVPSSATGLRRTSRAKVAKNNSEFIYYSKYKEIGSATSSN